MAVHFGHEHNHHAHWTLHHHNGWHDVSLQAHNGHFLEAHEHGVRLSPFDNGHCRWHIEEVAGGWFFLRHVHSGRYLKCHPDHRADVHYERGPQEIFHSHHHHGHVYSFRSEFGTFLAAH